MKQKTKEALVGAAMFGAGGAFAHSMIRRPRRGERLDRERLLWAGVAAMAGAAFAYSGSAGGLDGYVGRQVHPLHPFHPYRRLPAVWGGRVNGFDEGFRF